MGSLAVLALAATPARAAPPSQPNPQPLWNAYPLAGTQTQSTPVQSSHPSPKPAANARAKSSSGSSALYDAGITLTAVLALGLAVWVVSSAGVAVWGQGRRRQRPRAWHRRTAGGTIAPVERASSSRRRPAADVAHELGRGRDSIRDVTAQQVGDRKNEHEPETVTDRAPETMIDLLDSVASTSARIRIAHVHIARSESETTDVGSRTDEQSAEALKAKEAAPAPAASPPRRDAPT